MNLFMAGANFNNSSIEEREKIAFMPAQIREICRKICKNKSVLGCIVLVTCNRTEIYISCEETAFIHAKDMLIECSRTYDFKGNFEEKNDIDAVHHIIELACGLKSHIIGDEQIVSQIDSALKISMEEGCTDSVLNTLFRTAVSAGKYKLANIKLTNIPVSSAYAAVNLMCMEFGNLYGKKVVVIGNGRIGKIIQTLLIRKGCKVFVTLRNYKNGNNTVERGCVGINYAERYKYVDGCDFVVTATKSPHYTITYDKLKKIVKIPEIIIDLALPRDVEPRISEICRCVNIDELCFESEDDINKSEAVYAVAEKFIIDFVQWNNYKMSLPYISEIKDIIAERILKSYGDKVSCNENIVKNSVNRTVDILLGSMKNSVIPEELRNSLKKITERARL